jgi:adenine deaminase
MLHRPTVASIVVSALALAACSQKSGDTSAVAAADLIITCGTFVTKNGDQPTMLKDLIGKTLMPGFIDGHAHAQQCGNWHAGS